MTNPEGTKENELGWNKLKAEYDLALLSLLEMGKEYKVDVPEWHGGAGVEIDIDNVMRWLGNIRELCININKSIHASVLKDAMNQIRNIIRGTNGEPTEADIKKIDDLLKNVDGPEGMNN